MLLNVVTVTNLAGAAITGGSDASSTIWIQGANVANNLHSPQIRPSTELLTELEADR